MTTHYLQHAHTQHLPERIEHLGLILGDQLDHNSALLRILGPHSAVVMAEVVGESQVQDGSSVQGARSSQQRTVLFLSAMRYFYEFLTQQQVASIYVPITLQAPDFASVLSNIRAEHSFHKLSVVLPGDQRVLQQLQDWCETHQVSLDCLADSHFIAKPGEFKEWWGQRKQPRMEHWYRYLRKHYKVLMTAEGKPEGGQWNYDAQNRKTFDRYGPSMLPKVKRSSMHNDRVVKQVILDVQEVLPELPGQLEQFAWPVTRQQALAQLEDFMSNRLAYFGDYQDAMWTDENWLSHSLIASSLNLKLLHPMEVVRRAEKAYYNESAPLNAVEGFIRQILGWREYVRGLYWSYRHEWATMNYLGAEQALPDFFWHGKTTMNCLAHSLKPVLNEGYGHHIQRLMVVGLFNLLYGTKPQAIDEWFLAMYVDAVAWVEKPNTLGMSQYADGGVLASKPYIASGNYIQRMSNYCKDCPYNPKLASGDKACPFTTLYWRFINEHQAVLSKNPRISVQVKNWHNKPEETRQAILNTAKQLQF